MTRPGRFDISVNVPTPDVKGRIEILDLYLTKVKVGDDVDKEIIARGTVGFTGETIKRSKSTVKLEPGFIARSINSNRFTFLKPGS